MDELGAAEMDNTLTRQPGVVDALSACSRWGVQPKALCNAPKMTSKVLLVDDEPIIVKTVRKHLKLLGYENFVTTTDATEAVSLVQRERPDVVILDISMPGVNGLQILQQIRSEKSFRFLPILMLSAESDVETRELALTLGATDFLAKPLQPTELAPRVRNAIALKTHGDDLEEKVRRRTIDLDVARLEALRCLARASEYRDDDTGHHVIRVGRYAAILGRALGLSADEVVLLEHAAQLHDVGKIGIPDSILLKPGKLTPEEFASIKQHCEFGKTIVAGSSDQATESVRFSTAGSNCNSPILRMASVIAMTHHERWDGSGYPNGLAGAQIPIEGRITAVADVFDALSSERPYKRAFPREKCLAILAEGRGTQFDPAVLDAFFDHKAEIFNVQEQFAGASQSSRLVQ
jgi:putative two-component system response regulator